MTNEEMAQAIYDHIKEHLDTDQILGSNKDHTEEILEEARWKQLEWACALYYAIPLVEQSWKDHAHMVRAGLPGFQVENMKDLIEFVDDMLDMEDEEETADEFESFIDHMKECGWKKPD